MLDHHEGVVGQAHHAGDVPRRDLEGFGAKDDGAFAELLEADAVMQTARRTAASIAEPCDQEIDILGSGFQRFRRCWRAGVAFRIDRLDGAAVPLLEQQRRLPQHVYGVELAVFENTDLFAFDGLDCHGPGVIALGAGDGRIVKLHLFSPSIAVDTDADGF